MGAADIPVAPGGSSSPPPAAGEWLSLYTNISADGCLLAARPKSPHVASSSTSAPRETPTAPSQQPAAQQTVNKSIQDFFDSIENEQGNQPNNNA
jgi:hypothetical protein